MRRSSHSRVRRERDCRLKNYERLLGDAGRTVQAWEIADIKEIAR
jgi:hypothetical protein